MASKSRRGGRRVRTLFLSDIHLGYRHARARELNEFLAGVEAECIVLVGDIVDALSLSRRMFWSAEHTQVVRTLLARGRAGSRLVYIPGNHEPALHRAVRAHSERSCASTGLRRSSVRTHSPCQPAQYRRDALRQHRRLGGVVLGAGRGPGWRARASALAACGGRRAPPSGEAPGRRGVRIARTTCG